MQQTIMSEEQIDAWRTAIRQTTFANYHYEMGIAILRGGERESAIRHLRQALDIQPDHWRAAYRLAEALRGSGAASEAARLFEAAERGLPGIADVLLAETLVARLDTESPQSLEGDVRAVLAQAPTNPATRLILAVILLKQDRTQEIVPVLEGLEVRATQALPETLIDHVARDFHHLVWRGMLATAKEAAERLRTVMPDHSGLGSLLAYVHLVQRHPDQALAALNSAREPLDSLALARKVLAQAGLDQWEAAEADLAELELSNAIPATRALLQAIIHNRHGDAQTALDWAAKGSAFPDNTATNPLIHAVLLEQAGATEQAQKMAQAALDRAGRVIDYRVAELAVPALMAQAEALLSRIGWTVQRL